MSRTPRSEVIQGERRRRDDNNLDRMAGLKLGIPPEFRDDKDHYYLWANDESTNVHDLTTYDDYDVVSSAKTEARPEDSVRRPVGTDKSGQPLYAQLLRKPVEYVRADQIKADERMKEQERQLTRSVQKDASDSSASTDNTYVKEVSLNNGGYRP